MITHFFFSRKSAASTRWIILGLLASAITAQAVDGSWKAGTASGNWSLSTNWTGDPSPVPGGAGSVIGLNTGNGGFIGVTIDGAVSSRTAGIINFGGSSNWQIYSGGGGNLTFDNSGSDAQFNVESGGAGGNYINAPVILASSLVVTNDSTTRDSGFGGGGITETGGARSITKNGVGTMSLGNVANSYSGGFTLNAGTVSAVNNAGFGNGTLTLNGGTVADTGGSRFYSNALVLGGNVTFGSADSGFNTFSGSSATLNTSVALTVGTGNQADIQGNMTGSGYSITKEGAGVLTLGGNNSYSGGFVLNAGTVTMGGANGVNTTFGTGNLTINGGAIGGGGYIRNVANSVILGGDATIATGSRIDYSGPLTLTGNRVLTNDVTAVFNGTIGDGGGGYSMTKAGDGTMWLGMTTHTGGTIVNAGVVNIGGSSTLASNGSITLNGGTLHLGTNSNSVGVVTINGGNLTNTSGSGLLSSDAGFIATGGNINAILAGNGSFTKNGAGTTTLGAATGGSNTYTGGTIVNNGTLALGANNRLPDSGALTVNGGAFDLATFSDSVGVVTLAGGSITSSTGVLTGSSYALQSGSASAILGGAVAAAKTTSGTVTLTGVNSYSGATSISAGTLIISGAGSINNTSGISASGGTLRYDSSVGLTRNVTLTGGALRYNSGTDYSGALTFTSGTVGGTNLNGTLNNLSIGTGQTISPGNSIGAAGSGNQTWVNLGSFELEFSTDGSTGSAGTEWDLLSLSGGLDLTGINTTDKFEIILVTMSDSTTPGLLSSWDPDINHTWAGFVTTTSGITGYNVGKFAFNIDGFDNPLNGSFSIVQAGNNLNLVYTTIPEPGTCILFGLGSAFMLWNLRRRRNC